jgi:hypothetical protein
MMMMMMMIMVMVVVVVMMIMMMKFSEIRAGLSVLTQQELAPVYP